jgi:ubiquinone/menaquinone biosynthesis C-methylase UbiE
MAPFPDNSFDVISISFVMHELPSYAADNIVRECTRLLKHGGVLTILDVDPATIMNLPPLRRFLFEISEPHVQDFTRKTDVLGLLEDAGLQQTVYEKNDPMNAHWMGRKRDGSWQ